MKNKLCILFLVNVSIPLYLNSQNLVINPSFEDTLTCQQLDSLTNLNYQQPLSVAAGWFSINSPDYFTSYNNNTPTCYAQGLVPSSVAGYQYPRSGSSHVGIAFHITQTNMLYYELIYSKLSTELIQGNKYCVEAFVSLGDYSQLTTSRMGIMFLSNSLFYDTLYSGVLFTHESYIITILNTLYNNSPKIENPVGNYIIDTLGWTPIQGDFIAQGGEKYILIGCFYTLAQFDTLQTNFPYNINFDRAAYYFVDDISITDCTVGIEETMQQEEVLLSPSLAQEYVTIEYKPLAGNSCRLEVFSSMGSRVMEQTLPKGSNKHRLTVSQLPPGVYYVRLQWAKQTAVGRFVKQ